MKTLFVVGDSISIQYGPYLKKMVEGRFHYDRKRGEKQALADLDQPVGANGGDSGMVLEYLKEEHEKGKHYDLLLINCGLHDIKTDPVTRQKQVTLTQYRDHLNQIIPLAQQMAETVIWIRTTDAVEEVHNTRASHILRFHEDVLAYNKVADEIMHHWGVPAIDLYTFTRYFGTEAYCDHVHFTQDVRRLQAAYIAGYLQNFS